MRDAHIPVGFELNSAPTRLALSILPLSERAIAIAPMISRIVSGGQTGVDRGALDFAIARGIAHGGFCPKGRRSESGRIPAAYALIECSSSGYRMRTALNVQHSDGTLILTVGRPEGGTRKTICFCIEHRKPKLVVDLRHRLKPQEFAAWVRQHDIRILNIAGPRESKHPGLGRQTIKVLSRLFAALDRRTGR
jgi:hypothetical protein